jgi:hypothetical protein
MRTGGFDRALPSRYVDAFAMSALAPACVTASIILVCAVLALLAPIAVKILAVVALAGPHNWIEFRYFLSRLPARWTAGTRPFFALSFIGLGLFTAGYVALMLAMLFHCIEWETGRTLYSVWGSGIALWAGCLYAQRLAVEPIRDRFIRAKVTAAFLAAAAISVFAFFQPIYFAIALVYAHPLISLTLLDAEIGRSRPRWRIAYRCALALIPLVIGAFWLTLHDIDFPVQGDLAAHIVEQTGAPVLSALSSRFLLSTLVFVDLLHYAVWLIAIPNWSAGWNRWNVTVQPPVVTRFPALSRPLQVTLTLLAILLIGLWFCFATDYIHTSQIYFVLAIAHVLAEISFLAWSAR